MPLQVKRRSPFQRCELAVPTSGTASGDRVGRARVQRRLSNDGDTSDPDAPEKAQDRPASAPTQVEVQTLVRRNSPITIDLARFGKRTEKSPRIESFVHGAPPEGAAPPPGEEAAPQSGAPAGVEQPRAGLQPSATGDAGGALSPDELAPPSGRTLKGLRPIKPKLDGVKPPAEEAPSAARSLTRTLLNLPMLPGRLLARRTDAPKAPRATPQKPLFRIDDSDWYLTRQRGRARRHVLRWVVVGLAWAGIMVVLALRWKQGWRPW